MVFSAFRLINDLTGAGFVHPCDAAAGCRLAAAGFADQAQGFARQNGEADIGHGVYEAHRTPQDAALDREAHVETAHIQQRAHAVRALVRFRITLQFDMSMSCVPASLTWARSLALASAYSRQRTLWPG